jgi:hypothetical protein
MESSRAIKIVTEQLDWTYHLQNRERFSPEFTKWKRNTEVALEKIFGKESRHLADFNAISYSLSFSSTGTPDSEFDKAFRRGLEQAAAVLESIIDEIERYGEDQGGSQGTTLSRPDSLSQIEQICTRFHSVARQLRSRHGARSTIEMRDEYDVQDLFHALLKIHFDDIRPEEWTPSYAGGSSRMDFLLKPEKVVIEIKKTRDSMTPRDLGDQLILDVARYSSHSDCEALVCFVYDPEGMIGNPVGVERDLEALSSSIKLRVIVAPKS